MLAVNKFLNEFFHIPNTPSTTSAAGVTTSDQDILVDLSSPLTYADRFRIRKPNPEAWTAHAPHIDGGSIEKWEDEAFRDECYRVSQLLGSDRNSRAHKNTETAMIWLTHHPENPRRRMEGT